jgi:hypothetical protein
LHFVVALGKDGRAPTQENGCRHDLAHLSYPFSVGPGAQMCGRHLGAALG